MSWVAFTREAVSRHEDWCAALDHIAARHGLNRAEFWFQDSSAGAWLFDGAPGLKFDPIARVFDPVQYQRAKSSGDLEDVHSYFLNPEGNKRFHLTANRDRAPMTKTATKPQAKPSEIEFEVLKPIGRHGETLKKGDRFAIKRSSSRVHVDRWIAQGKLREVDASPNATAATAKPDRPAVEQAERDDSTPMESITRTREQMEAMHVECDKLTDVKKAGKVRPFEVDGKLYVATSGLSSADHGRFYIDANPVLEVSEINRALVPKKRGPGRFHYYGQPVTIQGKPFALGADKLRVRRSDCRCKECERLKLEANKRNPHPLAAEAAARRAKAGKFELSVPLARIAPSPWNPRKDFSSADAVAALDELAQSIREQGIIEPLIVRPTFPASEESTMYEIVAGERRYRAAKLAGLAGVPCIVRELNKLEAIRLQAVENLQRRDINAMEECEGYELLMREGKYTVLDIVRETGKSEATVYARLKLRDCPPGIRQALAQGRLPASTAELVARIEDVTFRGAAMDAILFPGKGEAEDGGDVLSFRQAKAWIENKRAWFEREAEWKKRAKDSHVAKTAKVLTAEESARELFAGGYVKNSQAYVKPTDTCHDDPKGRTYEAVARESGRELPPVVLACDPGEGKPVVLLPRSATMKVIADLVPDAAAQARRRQEADAQRRADAAEAERVRSQARVQTQVRAHLVADRVREAIWTPVLEESFLRLLVRERFKPWTQYGYDLDDLCAALRDHGVQLVKEDESHINAAWCEEYLDGTDAARLRAWLVWFAVRDSESFEPDEAQVVEAEAIFGTGDPQTTAVAQAEEALV